MGLALEARSACDDPQVIRHVFPSEDSPLPPDVTFTFEINFDHEVSLTRTSDGSTVMLEREKRRGAAKRRDIYTYEPQQPLAPGEYQLTSTPESAAPQLSEQTWTYVVEPDASSSALPDNLVFSFFGVVEMNNGFAGGGECRRSAGDHFVEMRAPGLGSDEEAPPMVDVEFRERRASDSPGETSREIFVGEGVTDQLSNGTFSRNKFVGFTPACVTFTAYSGDRTKQVDVETCEFDRCEFESDATVVGDDFDWTQIPACQQGSHPGRDAGMGGDTSDAGEGNRPDDTGLGTDPGDAHSGPGPRGDVARDEGDTSSRENRSDTETHWSGGDTSSTSSSSTSNNGCSVVSNHDGSLPDGAFMVWMMILAGLGAAKGKRRRDWWVLG